MTLIEVKFRFSPHTSQLVLGLGEELCSLGMVTPGRNPIMNVCIVRFGEQENRDRQLKQSG